MATALLPPEMMIDIPRAIPHDDGDSEDADEHFHNQGNSAHPSSDSPVQGTQKTPGFLERVQAGREEIVRSIFGEVGTPVEDFSCAVVSRILLHGRMYVTSSFVCFYSNLFGFEKIVKIPFCHMRCITKEKTALFIPNAIAIITSKKEYIFRSFWDREDAFRTLKECHQRSLIQAAPHGLRDSASFPDGSFSPRDIDTDRSQRRRVSRGTSNSSGNRGSDKDPDEKGPKAGSTKRRLPWSGRGDRQRISSAGSAATVDEDHRRTSSGTSSNASTASVRGTGEAAERMESLGLSALEIPGSSSREDKEEVGEAVERSDKGDSRRNRDTVGGGAEEVEGEGEGETREGSDDGESEIDVLGVEGSPVRAVSLGSTAGGGNPPSKVEEFKAALVALGEGHLIGEENAEQPEGATRSNAATVRVTAKLPCDLQMFFKLFIANDAEKGLPAFHESVGDSDVQATPWKVAGGALGMTREIRFVHPVSAPIGPNRTRAVKLQRCRLYSEHGLIIETSTHLEDIMMSDYFQIEDRCVVQPGQGGAIRVDVQVEIKFLKSTMFRKTIESKSLNETREVWESFLAMAEEAIRARQPALPTRSPTEGEESDDDERVRVTRERLRERRKHRQRSRNHPPHHPHDQHAAPSATTPRGKASSRPRAQSAASRIPWRSSLKEVSAVPRHAAGTSGGERKPAGAAAKPCVSVRLTPMPSVLRGLSSFAALPWLLLAVIFLWEGLQYVRFSSEISGFLEAAEAALAVLGRDDQVESSEDGAATPAVLAREELVRGLTGIYSRHRFVWPFSRL